MPRTTKIAATEEEPKHLRWADVEEEAMNPTITRQLAVGKREMLGLVKFKKGAIVPAHRHLSEQITIMLKGALKFTIHGKEYVVREGEVLIIPSNVIHEAVAMEPTEEIDCFSPLRHDWLNKKDKYLRTGKSYLRKR